MSYFGIKEFACPCCGVFTMNDDFLKKLNIAREKAGVPFIVNSGFRCHDHNRHVGGVENSAHTLGCAADIRADNDTIRFLIIRSALEAGIDRIGVAKNYVHLDTDKSKDDCLVWCYA